MNPAAASIISTERIRQRFTENQIRLFVERSLQKMNECPEAVETWISHYRTIYGEITIVYAKSVNVAKVGYKDEVPPDVLQGGEYASEYKLTEDEWKQKAQAAWEATGGDLRGPLPRPAEDDLAERGLANDDNDLAGTNELANDPFLRETERWYNELKAQPHRFKLVTVAYHWDAATDDYYYVGIVANPRTISEFAFTCSKRFVEAYKKFVVRFSGNKPTILFSSLWVTNDDIDDVRGVLCSCVSKAMAVLAGTDTDYQTMGDVAFFHGVTPSLTEREMIELSKGFNIQGER